MVDNGTPTAQPTESRTRGGAPGGFPWRTLLLPSVLFVLVLGLSATVAVRHKALNAYDEQAHFDYVVQLQQGNFPVPAGQRYAEETIQTWACRPVDSAMSVAPLCGEPNSASDPRLPFGGVNYEATSGPVYYAIVAGGSSILSNLGISDLTGARLVSSLLYALGAAVLLLVAQRMAFSPLAAGGVILAAASTGLPVSVGAAVTPDSLAFLMVAAVIASALLTRTWRAAVLATALVGVVAGLTKGNFIVVAMLGSMLLLLRWVSLERPTLSWQTARRLLAVGPVVALPVLLSAAGSFGWASLAAMRNTTGAPSDGGMSVMLKSTLGPHERVAGELSTLLHPNAPAGYTVLSNPVLDVVGQLVVLAVLGACLCAWLWRIDADVRGLIVLRSVALTIPLSAVALVAIFWVSSGGAAATSARYGLPFLAAASAGLGASIQRRAAVLVGILGLAVWLYPWVGLFLQGYL